MIQTLTTTVALTTIQAAYGDNLEQIRGRLEPLALVTEYREVVKAIGTCRMLRVQIEERRKMLKADALDYGRKVDSVAKALTDAIAGFEEPLKLRKLDADNAKAREKAAKEQAEREAREAEARAKVEAEQAEARARMAAEQNELAQRRAEIARLKSAAEAQAAAERAELESLRAQLATERAQAGAEAARAARELQELRQEREAAQTRARLAAEAEEQREAREKHERELEAKRAAAMPDRAALEAWATLVGIARSNRPMALASAEAQDVAARAYEGLGAISEMLCAFDGTPEAS
jgi:DNA repair exonuclease SbcCD ATPase subunit